MSGKRSAVTHVMMMLGLVMALVDHRSTRSIRYVVADGLDEHDRAVSRRNVAAGWPCPDYWRLGP